MPYCSCASDASAAGGASAESPPRFPQSAALAYPPFVRSSRATILVWRLAEVAAFRVTVGGPPLPTMRWQYALGERSEPKNFFPPAEP